MLKVLLTPYCLLKYFYVKSDDNRSGLAFVLIAKNEAPYIEEWLNFHRKQGVSHFIIYNNESTDNFREVLQPYIDSGLVSYHVINGKPRQLDAYNMAIHDYGHKFRYMGFIDADEFVFVRNNTYRGGGMTSMRMLTDS
ncbi:MAG: glycosyltransferase family 2 protein [Synergistaceae bacterium]|nr:glycosyltransferase family 2 protein [Synergistaceae bacterium]